MKKLMIAAAIVCAAVMSQAATYDWTIRTEESGELYAFGGSTKGYYSGSAYVFETAVISSISGEDIWNALVVDGGSLATYASNNGGQSVTFANGQVTGTFSTETDVGNASFVLVADDGKGHIFIDDPAEVSWDYTMSEGGVAFGHSWTEDSSYSLNEDDSATWMDGSWYTVQSVPEPTSGLLLLLGMAGLALRRRRA